MGHDTMSQSSRRIHYLDSIRGIAAMMVVVFHFIGWHNQEVLSYKLAAIIFNGPDAVSFFFVLSGFVLSYPYLKLSRKMPYWQYVIKRILRLYPAYIVLILLLTLGEYYSELSADLLQEIFVHNGRTRVWNEFAMVLNVHHLYFPGWTLRIEMIYSLIIPVLIWIAQKKKEVLLIIWFGSLFIGDVTTRMCMTHFLLGILLALSYPKLIKLNFRTSKWYTYRWPIFFLIFMLFSLRNIFHIFPQTKYFFDSMWQMNIRWEHFSAFAAFFLLAIIFMDKKTQALLEKKVLLFIGKISYSIYLIHWLVLKIIMSQWDAASKILGGGFSQYCLLFVVYLVATILLARLMYNWVEKPFIGLSKRLFTK